MADQRSRLQMDILARVAGIQEVQRLAAAVDETGDEMRGAALDAQVLERAIDDVSDEIAELNRELLRTGDVEVFEKIKTDRSTLSMLRRMRRELGDVADVGDESGRGFVRGFGDALSALPPHLRGALLAGAITGAALFSPIILSAAAGAVIGGVGAGGIIGGIVSASRDTRVKSAAEDLVAQLQGPFDEIGEAFIDPVRDSLNTLARAGSGVLGDLSPQIRDLGPVVRNLADGFAGLVEELGPGLGEALEEAGPVLRSIAAELPELGAAFGDMLSTIAEGSDGAIMGLRALINTAEVLLQWLGFIVRGGSEVLEFLVGVQEGIGVFGQTMFKNVPLVRDLFAQTTENANSLQGAVEDAGAAGEEAGHRTGDGFGFATRQIDGTNAILQRHSELLRAQTDPLFALLDAQEQNTQAQDAYNEAVKEHGADSPEAQAALLDQAKAALGLSDAMAVAADAWDGKFTPAQQAALEAAGFTKAELKELEDQLDDSRTAAEKWEGDYFADFNVTTKYRTEGTPPPFGLGALPSSAGPATAFQHGGMVFGPGGIDRVPAMLTAGEFVVRRQQAQRHLEVLQAINTGAGVSAAASATRGGDGVSAGVFEGNLFLSTGEFLGKVEGVMRRRDKNAIRSVNAGAGMAA